MWRSAIDKKGRKYYYHKLTREVSWHLPTDVLSEFSDPSTLASPTRSTGAEGTRSPAAALKASSSASPSQAAESFPSRPSRQAPRASGHRQNTRSSAGAHGRQQPAAGQSRSQKPERSLDFNDAVLEEAFSAARSQIQQQDEDALRRTRNLSPGTKKVAQSHLSLLKRRKRGSVGARTAADHRYETPRAPSAHLQKQQGPTLPAPATAENVSSVANDQKALALQRVRGAEGTASNTTSHAFGSGGAPLPVSEEQIEKLTPCATCGRTFNSRALAIHVKSCSKVSQKRKPLDMSKQRLGHLEDGAPRKASSRQPSKSKKQPKWKAQSGALRKAMLAARGGQQKSKAKKDLVRSRGGEDKDGVEREIEAKDSDDNEYDDGLIPCPHCHRRFNQKAAERHIPKCKDIKAKPKTLRRGAGGGAGGMQIKKRNIAAGSNKPKPSEVCRRTNRPARSQTRGQVKRAVRTPVRDTTSNQQIQKNTVQKKSVSDASRAGRKAPNTECPHCFRMFTKAVASRHIPKCAGIKAKPKPLSRNRAPGSAQRPTTVSGAQRNSLRSAKRRPATSHQRHGNEQGRHRTESYAAFDSMRSDVPSSADFEAELAARMEANVLQAQRRAALMTASTTKHQRRPSSADPINSAPTGGRGVIDRVQPPRRSALAWGERSNNAPSSSGSHIMESLEELPSELDQLHALGDKKFGGGRFSRRTASSRTLIESGHSERQQHPRKSQEKESYRGLISAEQLIKEAGLARARPVPAGVSHAPSFVSRADGLGEGHVSRPVVRAMDPSTIESISQLKEDVEQSAMTAKMERLARELDELDSLLGKKQRRRRR